MNRTMAAAAAALLFASSIAAVGQDRTLTAVPAKPSAQPDGRPAAIAAALTRLKDMESAKRLSSEGEALYQADAVKRTGGEYCTESQRQRETGDFREAIRSASKALFLGEKNRDSDLVALAKFDFALAYLYSGEVERAQQYAEELLKQVISQRWRRQLHSWAYKTLGDVAAKRQDHKLAAKMYGEALDLADGSLKFYARASLAAAFAALGDLERSRNMIQDADSYLVLVPKSIQPAARYATVRVRGALALKEGKPEVAVKLYESALNAQAEGADFAYEQFWAYEGLGRARLASGDKTGALQAYLDAISQSEKVRARFRSDEIKTGLFGELQEAFSQAVQLLMEEGRQAEAWEISERGRARALLDLLRNRVKPGGAAAAPPAKVTDLASLLKPGEVVIGYHVLGARTYGWAIRVGGVKAISIEINRDALGRQVEEYRDAVVGNAPQVKELAAKLHATLLRPFSLAEGEAVALIPHDVLHYLPFQALWDGEKHLIERHPVSYAPSGGALIELAARPPAKPGKLFALGNPDLGDPKMSLPGAQREVETIRTLFAESETYFEKYATRERLLKGTGQSSIIHVAAHASVDPVDPLFSKIYLAKGAEAGGNVEARDVYAMKLDGVSLVAISACESGLGKVSRGDEIWGFTRSFLSAGAPALVASLWPVADDATEKLMKSFYAEISKGTERRRALQVAQIEVMGDSRFAAPYFWAAFNLVGDWR